MKRTTVLADDDLLLEAQQIAFQQGTTLTTVVREALREYVAAHRPERRISFIGLGNSGDQPLDLRDGGDEEILAREIDPIHGWNAPRASRETATSADRAKPADARPR